MSEKNTKNKTKTKTKQIPHKDHRKRMIDRLLREGPDGFADHEILEMLLYLTIPRKNTNEIAHLLLGEFGSIRGVMDADVEMLMRIKGIGIRSATSFKLLVEAIRRYAEAMQQEPRRFTGIGQIGLYLHRKFIGVTRERLYMLLFNNRMNLLDCVLVAEGGVSGAVFPLNKVNDLIVKKQAAAVVLAHNHPNGLAVPSESDLEITDRLRNLLESIGVTLVEHLIIADNRFYPILKHRYGIYRTSKENGLIESGFYEKFYDVDDMEYSFPPIFPEHS